MTTQRDVEIAYKYYAQKLDELSEAWYKVTDCCNTVAYLTFETVKYTEKTAKHIKLALEEIHGSQMPLF